MSTTQFRVLCLHGYRQDSTALKLKMGALRKTLKRSEFVYVDAPNNAPENDPEEGHKQLSWFNNYKKGFKYDHTGKPNGFDKSCKVLDDCIAKSGPFDIILGFSQGACMAALYLAKRSLKGRVPFKAAILVSGFTAKFEALSYLTETDLSIPSFHIYSKNDTVIPDSATEEFMEHFSNPKCFRHEGGHGFPSSNILKEPMLDFFDHVTLLTEEESSYAFA